MIRKEPERVCIIGSAPSSRKLAPFGDPNWTMWACSPPNSDLPRIDLWFELHGDLAWPESAHWASPYLHWLNAQKFPVYAQDQMVIPRAMTFPKDELIARFTPMFFTSTFSWMLAYALAAGVKEVMLFGVDMATQEEHAKQKPHFHHFVDLAIRSGVKITCPYESDVLQPAPLYGYADATAMGRKLATRKAELDERIAAAKRDKAVIEANLSHLEGALDQLNYHMSVWLGQRIEQIPTEQLETMLRMQKSREAADVAAPANKQPADAAPNGAVEDAEILPIE